MGINQWLISFSWSVDLNLFLDFFFLVFLIWSVDLFSLAFCLDRKEFNGKSIIDRPAKELGDYEIENSDSE
jgi:hypothetical protein